MLQNAGLLVLAEQLRDALERSGKRLVLAESCTGGNVAASLATLPGISSFLCGGFVVYRNESKASWLGIDRALLDDPRIGPVSERVTRMLAQNALRITLEAEIALAVTGHLGPCDSAIEDGIIHCALVDRGGQIWQASGQLATPTPTDTRDIEGRQLRLQETTHWVIECAVRWLAGGVRDGISQTIPGQLARTDAS